jgi:hypothetical protein
VSAQCGDRAVANSEEVSAVYAHRTVAEVPRNLGQPLNPALRYIAFPFRLLLRAFAFWPSDSGRRAAARKATACADASGPRARGLLPGPLPYRSLEELRARTVRFRVARPADISSARRQTKTGGPRPQPGKGDHDRNPGTSRPHHAADRENVRDTADPALVATRNGVPGTDG